MSNEPVSARGLAKVYDGGVKAVDGVDLAIAGGAITALIGKNGAGKTTLLRMLAGVLAPTSGEVELLGVRRPSGRSLRKLQSRLSFVDQDPALDPEMSGEETLRLLGALYGVRDFGAVSEQFGLTEIFARRVASYSGGQRRRLHLAGALLHSPSLIFLDEPTAGLDAEGVRLLWQDLQRRTQAGATVVVVGHDLEEMAEQAATLVLLDRGKIADVQLPGGSRP